MGTAAGGGVPPPGAALPQSGYAQYGGPSFRGLASAAIYLQPEDVLFWNLYNTVSGLQVGVRARVLLPDGFIQTIEQDVTPSSDGSSTSSFSRLPEGWLLSLVVFPLGTGCSRGQCFAQLSILRSGTGFKQSAFALYSDYIVSSLVMGWPQNPLRWSTDGQGYIHAYTVSNPAAGADWIYTVASTARQRIISGIATLATAAAVANRVPNLVVDDGATVVFQMASSSAQAASTTWTYPFCAGLSLVGQQQALVPLPLPVGLVLMPGGRVRMSTLNIQAADQWSAIALLVEEWRNV